MGYDYSMDGDITIEKQHIDAALDALNKWSGTSYDTLTGWYQNFDTRWIIHLPSSGDFVLTEFLYSRNTQNEDMFNIISPYVQSRSAMYATGEDNERWRYVFKDGAYYVEHGFTMYSDEDMINQLVDRYGEDAKLGEILDSINLKDAVSS